MTDEQDHPVVNERGEQYVEFPFETHYTNNINIFSTYFDFSLLVCDRFAKQSTVRARIVMNPAHAKVLASVLAEHVRAYETKWGEIRLPNVTPEPSANDEEQQP